MLALAPGLIACFRAGPWGQVSNLSLPDLGGLGGALCHTYPILLGAVRSLISNIPSRRHLLVLRLGLVVLWALGMAVSWCALGVLGVTQDVVPQPQIARLLWPHRYHGGVGGVGGYFVPLSSPGLAGRTHSNGSNSPSWEGLPDSTLGAWGARARDGGSAGLFPRVRVVMDA